MTLVFLGDSFTFPEGDAATNRVHSYAKGLFENGLTIHVICFGSDYDAGGDGVINGIYFHHPFGRRKRSRYFIVRRWHKIRKYFNTFSIIKSIKKRDESIVFHCYTQLLQTQLFTYCLSKYFKSRVILERSEHPLRNYNDSRVSRKCGNLRVALEIRLCDSIFCISDYLINFYLSRGCKREKLFLVPSTVDTERFIGNFNTPFDFKYILYCGSLTTQKDGVDILIESFSKLPEKHSEVQLVLVGEADNEADEQLFRNLVSELKIEKKVYFTGKLPRNEIPAYLCNAELLALARPRSIVADAGFPSKLTEYLVTGKPVVVTSVGEIPVYLTDNQNAFLSEPGSADAFAGRMDFVLSNGLVGRQVGENGKALALTVFNYRYQAKRILDFINNDLK
jgi:glycosyltransferase involved in cell wall biosynthesis